MDLLQTVSYSPSLEIHRPLSPDLLFGTFYAGLIEQIDFSIFDAKTFFIFET